MNFSIPLISQIGSKHNGPVSLSNVSELLQPIGSKASKKTSGPFLIVGIALVPALIFLAWQAWSQVSSIVASTMGPQPPVIQVMSLLILVSVLGLSVGLTVNIFVKKITESRWLDSYLNRIRSRRKMAVYVSGSGSLGFTRGLSDLKQQFASGLSMVVFSHPPISAVKKGGVSVEGAVIGTAPVQDAMGNLQAALQGRSEETRGYLEAHDDFMELVGGGESTVEWDILHLGEGHTSESCHLAWDLERTTARVGANPARTVVVVRDRSGVEAVDDKNLPEGEPLSRIPTPGIQTKMSLESALGSVVKIISGKSSGTGVIVHPDGFVASCAHVLEESDEIEVWFPSGYSSDGEVVARDETSDVALIRCRGVRDAKTVEFCPTSKVALGDPVIAAGFPSKEDGNQFKPSITHGFIRGLARSEDHSIIRSDAEVRPGFSGGALFDQDGLMLGMVTSLIRDQKSDPPSSASTCALSSDDVVKAINQFKTDSAQTMRG